MIQLIDRREIPRLLSFCKGSPYGVRISAFLQAYGTSYPFALFWMQTDASGRITAALSRVDGHVTLCASEQADWEEVWAFLSAAGYAVSYTHLDVYKRQIVRTIRGMRSQRISLPIMVPIWRERCSLIYLSTVRTYIIFFFYVY